MTSFDNPLAFLLVLALPGWLFLRARALRRGGSLRFPLDEAAGRRFEGPSGFRKAASRGALVLGILAWLGLVVAAAGPQSVERRTVFPNRGDDVMFALDLSPSMGARDVEPDRLSAAKTLLELFLREDRADSVGIVGFGREAALLCPPTTDYAALRERLARAKPGALGDGTALGLGLAQAIRHAARARGTTDRVILVTDGENNAGSISPEDACDLAARLGVRLTIIGVGSRGDVPLAYEDPRTGERLEGTYASGFDESALRTLAARAGGEYLSARDGPALERAFRAVSGRMPGAEGARSVTVRRSRAASVLAVSVVALALSWLLGLAARGWLS
ncbi:MAG TPA: VWA domain-containing protein [Spirochaetia bacterium]|nr:VWA domain-containing protein [Spirochaetales bacterium]HRY80183.1 VWA domain-containing protein [Spirochaetia bacterium]